MQERITETDQNGTIFLTKFLNSKNKPRGLYFSKALLEGLMYGGKFAFQNRLGQLIVGRKFIIFALFYFVFEGKFQVQVPRGGLYSEGRFNGGFIALRFWGAYTWRGLFSEFYGNGIYFFLTSLTHAYFQQHPFILSFVVLLKVDSLFVSPCPSEFFTEQNVNRALSQVNNKQFLHYCFLA